MTSKAWKTLCPGDVVDIIAPASHSPPPKLQAGVEWLESIGLKARVPVDLISPEVFFAAPLETQLKHLTSALHSDSKAIWCLRGGYGSMRLIPYLMKMKPTRPKAFLGFSDITSLHLFLNQNWKWPTLHSRVLGQMSVELSHTPDRVELENILMGRQHSVTINNLIPMNEAALKTKTIQGKLTGGNMRMIQTSLGSAWEMNSRGKIVFMEDIDERGYSIHRMLEQLHQAKLLTGLKALLFGDFTRASEKDGKDHSLHALETMAARVSYPVFRGIPSGHGTELNHTLPFNTDCVLETGLKGKLILSSGGL